MASATIGLSLLPEHSSRRAMTPFAVLSSLQHACGMRYRPAFDGFRRHLLTGQVQTNIERQSRTRFVSALDRNTQTRQAQTTCRVQSAVADPAVTGQPQREASPPLSSEHTPPKSSAYPFEEIEAKLQGYWSRNKTFKTPDIANLDKTKPKFYALDMFPYPRYTQSCLCLCSSCSSNSFAFSS